MKGFTPIEEALMPEQLKATCAHLLLDTVGEPCEVNTLESEFPILLVRSAHRDLFESFVERLHDDCPGQCLVVLSHARDEAYVDQVVRNPYEFLAYPVEGPYSLESLSKAFPRLKNMELGGKVMLDASGVLSGLDHVIEMLDWVAGVDTHAWCDLGPRLVRLSSVERRRRASEALLALSRWNALRLS